MTGSADDERQKALKRLKKILALAESSNPGEAAAALHQAQKLMALHGLSERDASFADVNSAEIKFCFVEPSDWERILVSIVATALGVVSYSTSQRKSEPTKAIKTKSREKARLVFIGEAFRAEIAAYAYEILSKRLRKDVKASLDELRRTAGKNLSIKEKHKRMYAIAWCHAVDQKVRALAPVSVSPVVKEYYRQLMESKGAKPSSQKIKASKPDAITRYMVGKGLSDGESVDIHQAVNNQESATLAIGVTR